MSETNRQQTVHMAFGVQQNTSTVTPAANILVFCYNKFRYDEGLIIVMQREAKSTFLRLNMKAIANGDRPYSLHCMPL